jgi:hypothetical protein
MIRLTRVAACLLLAGCSSQVTVTQIPNDTKAGTAIDGIPFRPQRSYRASLYHYDKASGNYAEEALTGGTPSVVIPDQDHLYVLGFHGDILANPTIEIALNPDSSIEHFSLSSKNQAPAALTEAGTQLAAVTKAVNDANTASKKTTNDNADAYDTALLDYYTKQQSYCSASKAAPIDLGAVRVKAADLYGSEVKLLRAAVQIGKTTPFATPLNPDNDVGVGCP